MDIRLAWRNIWRNPRRTAVILAAIVIGCWSMLFLGAFMRGIEAGMIANGIDTLTGDIQVQHRAFRRDPSVEHLIRNPAATARALIPVLPAGSALTARVRLNAVVSNARHTKGVTLVGIVPREERRLSFIGRAVREGSGLADDDDRGILLGRALAAAMETRIGKKLIIMARDRHGEIASRAFRIRGLFDSDMEGTEKTYVFITRAAAQNMLDLAAGVSEFSLRLPDTDLTGATAEAIRRQLSDPQLTVYTWPELLPLLRAYLELADGFIYIWYLVVFVAMGFGIVNTTLMAVFERLPEFGLMKALGMRPGRILRTILMESGFILILGMAAGNALGLLSTTLLARGGIDLSALAAGAEFAGISRVIHPVLQSGDVAVANLVVFFLGLGVSLYPALKAARALPVEAMQFN
jgi:ABC-type lipoprotein release transport system permease subunit